LIKGEIAMNRILSVALLFVLSVAQAVKAQEETTIIPVKEYIDGAGPVEVIISVYDQPQGGVLLYQVTKSVTAEEGLFDDTIEVPSELLSAHPQVFVEFTKASSPIKPLAEERMQFTQPTTPEAGALAASAYDASFCFTCGGFYPNIAGGVATRIGGTNIERGRGCSGGLVKNTRDHRPQLCSHIAR
jgi:hypothetical protein